MDINKSNGKWWLAAIVFPFASTLGGILFALGMPNSLDDWFGIGFLARIALGLLLGCLFSCIAAIISFARREKLSSLALLTGIPSFVFIIYVGILLHSSDENKKKQQIANVEHYKQETESMEQIKKFTAEFHSTPDLITNDNFWLSQSHDPKKQAMFALFGVLREKSFNVTPAIKDYVIKNFPDGSRWVFICHSSPDELLRIFNDPKYPRGVRAQALDCLLRIESFSVTPQMEQQINEFPQEKGVLMTRKQLAK